LSIIQRFLLVLFGSMLALVRTVGAQALPTIQVDARYKIVDDKNEPGMEYGRTFFKWTTQNAEFVLVVNRDVKKVPPEGEFEGGGRGGSYLFIAVGPGGSVAEYIDASLTSKSGPGRHGVLYKFDKDFDLRGFFEDAYKHSFVTNKRLEDLREAALKVLQQMSYTVDLTRQTTAHAGVLLYTKDFNFNKSLGPSLKEKRDFGEFQRQIAFVLMIAPPSTGFEKWQFYILPLVRRNYPRDNDKWEADPDGLQVGRPASQALANSIVTTLGEENP
jgi:hypothetical protein